MHQIEPFYNWRELYIAAEDASSPFFGREYSEFEFSNKVYNYYIHPQWDHFGSNTLYLKVLYADYDRHFAIIEFIGEWNDCINNDIMQLKRNIIDELLHKDIKKFVLIGENVLNYHVDDDSYYEEWHEDVVEKRGWIATVNFREHVLEEMYQANLHYYLGDPINHFNWRTLRPQQLMQVIEQIIGYSNEPEARLLKH